MPRTSFLVPALLLASLASAPRAQLVSRAPEVHMTQLVVQVEVLDGVASTRLTQTWRNEGRADAEAIWILPLPSGAVADGFTMTVGGVPLAGEVLGAEAARGVYEGIVRQRRDPGLLEYFGRGCLRARIFPIPPRGEVRVEVGFRALLPERAGLRQWSFALGAAGAGGLAPERVVLDLALRSRKPLKNAFSPLAAIQVLQKGEHEVRASFEGSPSSLTGGELSVFYGLSEAEFGLDLLTHRGAGADEGTFLMLVSPKREWQRTETLKKSIVFVLDTSGSMEGQKIEQARAALRLFLQSLQPEDRFDVVPFATEPEPFFGQRVPASPEHVGTALEKVARLTAAGGTNIDGALAAALGSQGELEGRVPIVVFLTDGEPTVGETIPEKILAAVRAGNRVGTRLFVLGVGANVNTHLLDTLAAQNGGARDYVREEERIDEKTRALFAKLSHPVMTDLTLSIDGLTPLKVVPARLPDLFAGDRLEVFGRYAGEGAHAIRLSGVVAGVRREYVYEGSFPRETAAETAFLGALWAERRVGVLLDALRLNGTNPELVSEIERLGREYRIVTPYTSHLVVEPGLRVAGGGPGAAPSPGGSTSPAAPASPLGLSPRELDELRALGYAGGEERASADGFFRGPAARGDGLVQLASELKRAGVLPPSAEGAELARLTSQVARELRDSEQRWSELGKKVAGEQALDDSQYLAGLMARGRGAPGTGRTLLELFTRRVQDKTFVLRAGIWVDQTLGEQPNAARRRVEAYSSEYFALLRELPRLAPYLALSPRLIVALEGEVFEVFEAPAEPGR